MDLIELGKYLKGLRKNKGLTLVTLSEMSGVSNPYLSQIENGKFKPSPEILKKLSVVLEIPYAELLAKAGYEELHKAVRISRAFDDFKDEFDMSDTFLRMTALEGTQDIENFLLQESHLLQSEKIQPKYKGHLLTEQDRKRILTMLEVLFPEYQNEEE